MANPNADPFAQNPYLHDPYRAVGGQTFAGGPTNAILGMQKPFSYPDNNPRSVPGSSPGGHMAAPLHTGVTMSMRTGVPTPSYGSAQGFNPAGHHFSAHYAQSGGLAAQAARGGGGGGFSGSMGDHFNQKWNPQGGDFGKGGWEPVNIHADPSTFQGNQTPNANPGMGSTQDWHDLNPNGPDAFGPTGSGPGNSATNAPGHSWNTPPTQPAPGGGHSWDPPSPSVDPVVAAGGIQSGKAADLPDARTPMAAYGGTVMHRAIVGDPQADGGPNPELVEAYGPIRVTPLRNLPRRQAHASWAHLPHYDQGGTTGSNAAPAPTAVLPVDTNLSSDSIPPPAPPFFQNVALPPDFSASNPSSNPTPFYPMVDTSGLGANAPDGFGSANRLLDSDLTVPPAPSSFDNFQTDPDSYLQPSGSVSDDGSQTDPSWAGWTPANLDDTAPWNTAATAQEPSTEDDDDDASSEKDEHDSFDDALLSRLAGPQYVAANGPPKTPEQERADKTDAEIQAVPPATVSKEELNSLHESQRANSYQALTDATKKWWSLPNSKPNLFPYVESQMHDRWEGLKKQMEAQLDAGKPEDAARTIRQMYSDLAVGGSLYGETTASRFLSDWLNENRSDRDPSNPGKGTFTTSELQSLLDTKRVQNAVGTSVMNHVPEMAVDGPKTIQVKDQILPEITIGDTNRNMYHTLGQYTYSFTGTIQKGQSVTKDGRTITPVTLDGSFTVHDTYDWADSHQKHLPFFGFDIADSYGHLVEQQGLAKPYDVGGTIRGKVTTTVNTQAKSPPPR